MNDYYGPVEDNLNISKSNGQHISTLFQDLKRLKAKERHLDIIHEFTSVIIPQSTVTEVISFVARFVVDKIGFEKCKIYLFDSSGKYLIRKAAYSCNADLSLGEKVRIGEGIVGSVAETGIGEVHHDTLCDTCNKVGDAAHPSQIAVPIITHANTIIGVLDSEHPNSSYFTKADFELLSVIASILASKILQATCEEQLRNSNESLEQFAYSASHDLKEPLRMVSAYSQLLEKKYSYALDGTGLDYLKFVKEGASNLTMLIEDLLSYARLSKEQPRSKVDCNEVLDKLVFGLQVKIDESQAVINYSDLPEVWGHFSQLLQLFQNLISNALKYRSDEPPVININATETFDHYLFSVSDNGIGIAGDQLHNIFNVFFKLHKKKDYDGTGIGLAICRKTVQNFGGQIWVESEQGQGSTFFFTIPK